MKLIIDTETWRKTSEDPLGASGFISWPRLLDQLRKADEFQEGEKPSHLVVSERGVDFRFK